MQTVWNTVLLQVMLNNCTARLQGFQKFKKKEKEMLEQERSRNENYISIDSLAKFRQLPVQYLGLLSYEQKYVKQQIKIEIHARVYTFELKMQKKW